MAGRKTNEQKMKELDTAVRKGIEEGLKEVLYQFNNIYTRSIDRFYKDYEPHRYDRTFTTYAGSDLADMWGLSAVSQNTYRPFMKNIRQIGKNTYYGAMNIDYSYIYENTGRNPYNSPLDYVFERTFVEGIHGMTPEEAKARKLSWHKKPMNPPPKHFMDKEYLSFQKDKKRLDGIFDGAISRELSRLK